MKRFKKILALAIAMAMVLGMTSMAAFADPPASGSITVNSPIMGAKYYGYKVFDLSMDDNENPTAFSYTIAKDSPFYKAVASYATEKETIALTAAQSDPNTFNISIPDGKTLDAQDFGKWLRARLAEDYEGEDKITVPTAQVKEPTYEEGKTEVTVATASAITFENLAWGYYLITNNYDDPTSRVEVKLEIGTEGEAGYQSWTFTKDSTTAEIETGAEAYANAKYPDENAAKAYVEANASQFDKAWENMSPAEKAKVLTDLQDSTKANAIAQVNNAIAAAASDDNAQTITERFVFIDSTTPDAVINEKNELNKWDVPVNPDGHADLPDLPDHDEPNGGKNIIVGENSEGKAVYANSEETNIGDEVHYQLSINAVNYERDTDGKVQQIKEYIIADYQNKNMEFVEDKGLKVSIVKKDKDGNITETIVDQADYTSWVTEGYFFTNTNKTDLGSGNVFNGTGGIVIPWVEEITEAQAAGKDNVYSTTFDKVDGDGNIVYKVAEEGAAEGTYIEEGGVKYVKGEDGNKIPETETQYFASIYPNDVTILVDYYMTLTDTAVIDGNGNVNYSQYGVNYLTPSDKEYKPAKPDTPPEEPKEPTVEKQKDDAVVYTYAIALKKVDDAGNPLAGAKFKIRGVKAEAKSNGWYKVTDYDHNAADFDDATELIMDDKGVLVVEGLPQKWTVEVQETEAPAGFNKLTETKQLKPEKTGSEVTTTSTVTYTDVEGNVTVITTEKTEYKNAAGNVVATMEKVGDAVTYKNGSGTVIEKSDFDTLVASYNTVDGTDVTAPASIATLTIENNKGAELPSTGGIGTTIFYVVGAILVIGAGVILITKRRMDA